MQRRVREIAMASFKRYEIVELIEDIPKDRVKRGTRGTIIGAYGAPGENAAYEVEIADKDGRSLAQFVATPQQLRQAWSVKSILRRDLNRVEGRLSRVHPQPRRAAQTPWRLSTDNHGGPYR